MALVQFVAYHALYTALLNKEIDINSDTIKATLHTNSYTPNKATHNYVDDLSNELPTANGYTAGGVTLTGVSIALTAANSWTRAWAAGTAYLAGQIVRPSTGNGLLYRAVDDGSSHATTEPTWPTVYGESIVDNGVTWLCVGAGVVVLTWTGPSPAWAAFAGTFRHIVLSDRTPGTAATQPLIGYASYGSDQTGGGGDFDLLPDGVEGALTIPVP